MPDPPRDAAPDPPDDPGSPRSPTSSDRLDALLDALDPDDLLADLVAARASGTLTASDRQLWASLDAARDADPDLDARLGRLESRVRALTHGATDPATRFRERQAAGGAHDTVSGVPGRSTSREAGRPGGVPRLDRADRAPAPRAATHRAQTVRSRWAGGVLVVLTMLVGVFATLRREHPRLVSPSDVAVGVTRGAEAPPSSDPEATYQRAARHLARAERSLLGVHVGTSASDLRAARSALDSVLATTPAGDGLHLDAQFLRGVACQLDRDRVCARQAFTAVVDGNGAFAAKARLRLARLAR